MIEQLTEEQAKWAIRKAKNKINQVVPQPLQLGGKAPVTGKKTRRKNKRSGEREYSRPHPEGNRKLRRGYRDQNQQTLVDMMKSSQFYWPTK